jgi:glycosyltransferase involved in cell wall biosynthesis
MLETYQNVISGMHPLECALLCFFILLFLIQVTYMFLFTMRVAFNKKAVADKPFPLSLLMVLRNEEDSLRNNLPGILSLNNSEFEIVVVDNFSQDSSLDILEAMRTQNQKLHISRLKQDTDFSEKMAQNIGMKAARYGWVMSVPPATGKYGPGWISGISSFLNHDKDVIVNYSNAQPGGSFINLLYRVEFFFQQLKSFGFILSGMPYVVSQDNVAFKKDKYFEVGGYRGKITEPYVQLELVINTFIRKGNALLNLTGETAINQKGKISAKDYIDLVKKESSIRKYLSPKTRIILAVIDWVFFLYLPVAVALVILTPGLWTLILILLVLLGLCNLFIIKKLASQLNETKLFLPSLTVALLLPVIKLLTRALYGNYGRKKRWKKII